MTHRCPCCFHRVENANPDKAAVATFLAGMAMAKEGRPLGEMLCSLHANLSVDCIVHAIKSAAAPRGGVH